MKQIIYICLGLLLLFTSNTPIVAQEVSDYTQLSEEDYSNITLPPLSVLFENLFLRGVDAHKDQKTIPSMRWQMSKRR